MTGNIPQPLSQQKIDEAKRKISRCANELATLCGEYNLSEAEVSFEVTRVLGQSRFNRAQAMQKVDQMNIEKMAKELAKKKSEEAADAQEEPVRDDQ